MFCNDYSYLMRYMFMVQVRNILAKVTPVKKHQQVPTHL